MKYSLGISNFLEEILVFPILLFSSISLHWSLMKAFLSLLAILQNSAFKWVYLSFSPLLFTSLFFPFIFISWRLITLQYCSGFCHTLTWISHGFTCIPHRDPPFHLPLHQIPLGLFTAICKPSSDSHFAFLYFFFLGMVLIPVSCTMSQTSVHSSSGTLSIRSSPVNLFLTSTV